MVFGFLFISQIIAHYDSLIMTLRDDLNSNIIVFVWEWDFNRVTITALLYNPDTGRGSPNRILYNNTFQDLRIGYLAYVININVNNFLL